ncbi:MAG: peptidoglycan-binding domain-containing protein [Candidatus Omnitrophota bacterium]
MRNRYGCVLISFFIMVLLSGCATTSIEENDYAFSQGSFSWEENKNLDKDSQIDNLISALDAARQENQRLAKILTLRDKKINSLALALQKDKNKNAPVPKVKSYYFYVMQIQAGLRNAGFDSGVIDGKLGQRTQARLMEFQRANNLPASGAINKQTWILLRKYR